VVTKKTPGQFRTRVIQDGVHPSLHINYKDFDLKRYFKEGVAVGRKARSRIRGILESTKDWPTCPI
jgi:hypothetical protein